MKTGTLIIIGIFVLSAIGIIAWGVGVSNTEKTTRIRGEQQERSVLHILIRYGRSFSKKRV